MTKCLFESSGQAPRSEGITRAGGDKQCADAVQDDSATVAPAQAIKSVNLLAKAVALLSRREYSVQELHQKLAKYTQDSAQIATVIARLQKENWQSDERFAENFVLSRQARWGNQRILHILHQHNLPQETMDSLTEHLRETEFERAREIWERKFHGEYPTTPQAKAKQMRFLASRGFSTEVVYRVMRKF